MVIEQKAIVEQAVQDILDLLRNQNVYNVSQIQNSIQEIEHRLSVSMLWIGILQWTAFALAVGAGIYVLLRKRGKHE